MKSQILFLSIVMMTLSACSGGGRSGGDSSPASQSQDNAGSVPDSGCYAMDANTCTVFKATNAQRIANGVAALVYCQACTDMAYEQSKDMHDRKYFDHTRPDETFAHRASRFGLGSGCGENIAQGYAVDRVVPAWMQSSGHRANILNASFRSFGVGIFNGYYTQVFYSGTNR